MSPLQRVCFRGKRQCIRNRQPDLEARLIFYSFPMQYRAAINYLFKQLFDFGEQRYRKMAAAFRVQGGTRCVSRGITFDYAINAIDSMTLSALYIFFHILFHPLSRSRE